MGGFLFVAGVATLIWQFRMEGAPPPLPGLQGLGPGVTLYGAAAAAGLGLAMAAVGWRAAARDRQNEDFWNSATRVGPGMAGYRDEDDDRLEAQEGPGWRWLVPFMIAGFITGAVFYLEQTWYYTNSPYRFMAITFILIVLVVGLIFWGIWRGVRAIIHRGRSKDRRWVAAVRGAGRSMRGARAASPGRGPGWGPEAGSGLGQDLDQNPDSDGDLGAPDRQRLAEAVNSVLEHEQQYRISVAAATEGTNPAEGGKPSEGGGPAVGPKSS